MNWYQIGYAVSSSASPPPSPSAARKPPTRARASRGRCTTYAATSAAQLAPLSLRYLGMLGSRRKVAMTAGVLRSWSVSEEAIDRMHAPVGLSIGADTPEEIAISVVAEMIAVRRDGSRRRGGVQIETAEVSP